MSKELQMANFLLKNSRKLCRVCLTKNIEHSTRIFEGSSNCIASMVMLCARVQIVCQDGLPDIICAPCLGDLEAANSFRVRCELADALLRKSCTAPTNKPDTRGTGAQSDVKEELSVDWIKPELEDNDFDIDTQYDTLIENPSFEIAEVKQTKQLKNKSLMNAGETLHNNLKHKKAKIKNLPNFESNTESQNQIRCELADSLPTDKPDTQVVETQSNATPVVFCVDWIKPEMEGDNVDSDTQYDSLVDTPPLETTEEARYKSPAQSLSISSDHSTQQRDNISINISETSPSSSELVHSEDNQDQTKTVIHNDHTYYYSLLYNNKNNLHDLNTGNKPHVCDVSCFTTDPDLSTVIKCYICNADFPDFSALTDHISLHKNRCECPNCGKTFSDIISLFDHTDRESCNTGLDTCNYVGKYTKRVCICDICGKQLSSQHNLEVHIKRHMNVRCIQCEFCSRTFVHKMDLASHISHLHTDPKYECDFCGRKIRLRLNLITHLKIHEGKKNFKCQICDYRCYQKHGLNKHMLSHSEERKHSCPVCEAKFKRSTHINRHMLRIHKIKYRASDYLDRRVIK